MLRCCSLVLQRRFEQRKALTVPEVVGKLLEKFAEKGEIRTKMTVGKLASSLSDDINESLCEHGGLARFATSNPNFFTVVRENGTLVVFLSDMSANLCRQKYYKEEQRALKAQIAPKRY
jgi:hypothetical protein